MSPNGLEPLVQELRKRLGFCTEIHELLKRQGFCCVTALCHMEQVR